MKSSELGLSAMYRILKKSGAERISDESVDELRRVIEDLAVEISTSAVDTKDDSFKLLLEFLHINKNIY